MYSTVEREMSEKKRLSMENEELHWRVRQHSTDNSMMSMSVLEGEWTNDMFMFKCIIDSKS